MNMTPGAPPRMYPLQSYLWTLAVAGGHTMASGGEPPLPAPGRSAQPPRVAIVDADRQTAELLDPALRGAGYEPHFAALRDFPDGRSALAALAAGGVALVVYDLSPTLSREDPDRLRDFIDAATAAGVPLLVSNMTRWLQEEQSPAPSGALGARGRPAVERLLRAIDRIFNRLPEQH
jgi:DNA-binding NtrC family response regulator